jgi:hypothetical protein
MSYFHMNSLRYAAPVGTIRVRKPIRSLGPITDIDGNEWDIQAVSGGGVAACPRCELHPYFTDTSGQSFGGGTIGSGLISQEWKPYRVEVVEETT